MGFLACKYDERWWLGCVLATNEETQEIKVSFLHPHKPPPLTNIQLYSIFFKFE